MSSSRIIKRTENCLSQWVTLVENEVDGANSGEVHTFHSLALDDYVSCIAVTPDDRLLLVRQFRPAVDMVTLELPGGMVEPGEDPLASGLRELEEETGFQPIGDSRLFCTLRPDTGRLENRIFGIFTRVGPEAQSGWKAEDGVEPSLLHVQDVIAMVHRGEFDQALHVALLMTALSMNLIG